MANYFAGTVSVLPIQRNGVPYFDYRGAPTRLPLAHQSDHGQFTLYGAPDHLGANEDVLILASHNETHIDALSHVFNERTMYNGIPVEAVSASAGSTKLGIEKTATRPEVAAKVPPTPPVVLPLKT